jgi:hypothetical protein
MLRIKSALSSVMTLFSVILFAVALPSCQSGDENRNTTENPRPANSPKTDEKRASPDPSASGADFKDLIAPKDASDRSDSNAPRLKTQQIKMH